METTFQLVICCYGLTNALFFRMISSAQIQPCSLLCAPVSLTVHPIPHMDFFLLTVDFTKKRELMPTFHVGGITSPKGRKSHYQGFHKQKYISISYFFQLLMPTPNTTQRNPKFTVFFTDPL